MLMLLLYKVIYTSSTTCIINKHYQKYTKCQKYKIAHLIKYISINISNGADPMVHLRQMS